MKHIRNSWIKNKNVKPEKSPNLGTHGATSPAQRLWNLENKTYWGQWLGFVVKMCYTWLEDLDQGEHNAVGLSLRAPLPALERTVRVKTLQAFLSFPPYLMRIFQLKLDRCSFYISPLIYSHMSGGLYITCFKLGFTAVYRL